MAATELSGRPSRASNVDHAVPSNNPTPHPAFSPEPDGAVDRRLNDRYEINIQAIFVVKTLSPCAVKSPHAKHYAIPNFPISAHMKTVQRRTAEFSNWSIEFSAAVPTD